MVYLAVSVTILQMTLSGEGSHSYPAPFVFQKLAELCCYCSDLWQLHTCYVLGESVLTALVLYFTICSHRKKVKHQHRTNVLYYISLNKYVCDMFLLIPRKTFTEINLWYDLFGHNCCYVTAKLQ